MLYCNNCGQCVFINDERFTESAHVSGSEIRYLSPQTGEIEDYGDQDVEATGDSTIYCPHCDSSDIDTDWEGEEEEALEQRRISEERMRIIREARDKEEIKNKIKDSEWDLEENLI